MNERKKGLEGRAERRDRLAVHLQTIRHWPTDYNLEGRVQGNSQSVIQEAEIENYFERVRARMLRQPEIIVVSGLVRTRQTAERLVEYNHWPASIPIIERPEFNERRWGIFEGHNKEELRQLFLSGTVPIPQPFTPEELRSMEDLSPVINAPGFKVTGGETMGELGQRIRTALEQLRELYPGKKVLLVCHLGALSSVNIEAHRITTLQVKKTGNGGYTIEAELETG